MSSLLAKLKKNSTIKNVKTVDESDFFNDKHAVTTSVPLINLALSGSINGGVTSGLTVIAAPSKHFKSMISLFMVAAYLKKYPEAVCIFYDSEFGSSPDYMTNFGIDLDRVLHVPVESVEKLRTDVANQLEGIEAGDKVIFFLDSIGNLASKKETEDALSGSEKADMTRAKTIKSLFRIITPQLTIKDVPFIVINHTINTMEMFSKTVMTGGCCAGDTQVVMGDNSVKSIMDIKPGEFVKTMTGSSEVTHAWNPETLENGTPECYELTFDDGYRVITSDTHRFLCSEGDQYKWVEAKDLTEDHDIVSI